MFMRIIVLKHNVTKKYAKNQGKKIQRKTLNFNIYDLYRKDIPATPPSNGSSPIDLGNASCNPAIIGSSIAI